MITPESELLAASDSIPDISIVTRIIGCFIEGLKVGATLRDSERPWCDAFDSAASRAAQGISQIVSPEIESDYLCEAFATGVREGQGGVSIVFPPGEGPKGHPDE